MKLTELCQAFRNGDRWYIFDGSQEVTGFTRNAANAELAEPLGKEELDNVPNGVCWQLFRQISFQVMGSEPMRLTDFLDNASDDILQCRGQDIITIAECLKKVRRMQQ